MDTKSKVLFTFLAIAFIASVYFTYQRTMVRQDYTVIDTTGDIDADFDTVNP